ncbi:MAG TPA: DUF3298 domain-containing protein [Chitinophagaceae bacterium]|jgi:hypothetical protein
MRSKNILLFIIPFITYCVSAQNISWYKCLNGTIDKYPITMHLHKMDHNLSGYYYYNSKLEPIYFIGEDTTVTGRIKLYAFSKSTDPNNEEFLFSTDEGKYFGQWRKNDSSAALVFSATESTDTSLIPFALVYVHGEVKLKPDMKESPAATYEAASVWPQGNSTKTLFIKKIIGEQLGEKDVQQEIEAIFLKNKSHFFDEYKEAYREAKEEDMKDMPSAFSEEQINHLMIVYQSKNILTLANYSYSYTGGAHGNFGTAYSSLDLVKKKKLKLDDVLTASGQTRLPLLLIKYFRKNYNLDANTSLKEAGLFEEKIKPNNNFYVTGKGIGFSYAPYEIGPYAMGEINIFVPIVELKKLLQPAFQNLLEPGTINKN